MKIETKMTTKGHCRGSEEDHSRRKEKEEAKENGMRMSQEKIDRERVEIKFHLELLMEMLQRSKLNQRYGWSMKRKVKWHRLQVKWKHSMNVQLKEELLRLNEYVKEDLICEPEYGPLLFESNDETEEKYTEKLNQMEDSEQ